MIQKQPQHLSHQQQTTMHPPQSQDQQIQNTLHTPVVIGDLPPQHGFASQQQPQSQPQQMLSHASGRFNYSTLILFSLTFFAQ